MPSSFYVTEASEQQPFLAVVLNLDKYLLTRLAAEIPTSSELGKQILGYGQDNQFRTPFLWEFYRQTAFNRSSHKKKSV